MALKLITPSVVLAVTVADAKTSLRIDGTDLDAEVTGAIHAATKIVEHESGRCIMAQTFELTLDAFPDSLELTRFPVQSITRITYADSVGASVVLSNALYALDAADDYGFAYAVPVYAGVWPETRVEINAVKVRYVAGYATTAADVRPEDALKIKTLLAYWVQDPTSLYERLDAISKVYA